MNRAMTGMASGLLMISTFLGALAAQEPKPAQQPKPAQPPGAQAKAGETPKAKDQEKKEAAAKAKAATEEEPIVTHHQMPFGGAELKYTATAGLMPIKDAKGEIEARIFFIAYTRDDAGTAAARPLLFSFNGGPGSASVWLHLGALGPRRVDVPDEPVIPAPPFALVDNDATWLDRADLVFIDPVGTGYSRAAKPELNAKFHSLSGDIESVGEFIRMYLTRYNRWSSPLYLIGESYGTTRAAGLAGHLVDSGIAFNGVILVSCALDFQGFVFSPENDLPFLNYLPSYAAAAWYHKRLPADLQKLGLPAVLKEVEGWVDREYSAILARGDRLTDDERNQAAARLARYTGLKADDIEEHRLRIVMSHFCSELLRAEHRSLGRFDARYKGIENLGATDRRGPSHDPSLAAVLAPYTTTFNHYVRDVLEYKSDVPYYILGGGVGRWDFQTEMGYPATTAALRDALTKNPHMQVLIASGYYDLATPYRAVEHSLAGLGLDPVLRQNITTETYDAGHMMYLHMPSLHKLKRDGAALIDRALKKWYNGGAVSSIPQESSTMPSPFPGMDPYLEAADIWPDFHHSFAVQLSGELNGSLPPGHYAEIVSREELGMIEEGEVTRKTYARLTMVGRSLPRAGRDAAVSLPRQTASPSIRVTMHDEPIRHFFVEIRDPTRNHKLITLIEIVSPFNKVPGPDREAYEAKQREVLESDASLIEIDLLRGGSRIVPNRHVKATIDRLKLSPAYVVLVNRAWKRSNAALAYHVYPIGLRDLLPCIWVPLKEHEDEILLDLQYVFNQVHDAGPYRRGAVDYAGPVPAPALDDQDAAWAAELTRPWREASAGG